MAKIQSPLCCDVAARKAVFWCESMMDVSICNLFCLMPGLSQKDCLERNGIGMSLKFDVYIDK